MSKQSGMYSGHVIMSLEPCIWKQAGHGTLLSTYLAKKTQIIMADNPFLGFGMHPPGWAWTTWSFWVIWGETNMRMRTK